jgi:hypothetical protein
MPRGVMASIRRTSPLARARPGSPASRRWSLARQMIRSPAEVDQVVADPSGQFPAADPVDGHQQGVATRQVGGHVGASGWRL